MEQNLFKGKKLIFLFIVGLMVSFACRIPIPNSEETPPAETDTIPVITETPSAAETTVVVIPETPTPNSAAVVSPPSSTYLDDRSSPIGLMNSFFNALNRREYLRAYSYWRNPADSLGDFNAYMAGYETTDQVSITFGQIGGDAGAGQMFYNVPLLMDVLNTDGSTTQFVACYVLHLANPSVQGEPPFTPLAIQRGGAQMLTSGTDPQAKLSSICTDLSLPTGPVITPVPVSDLFDYSADNYLDDRSDVVQVLRSMVNALNRHEYVRAYSYWKNPETVFTSFNDFLNQYEDVTQVEIVYGETGSDPGAGQLYDYVPAAIRLTHTDGTVETVQTCFVTHISQPAVQASPPFKPRAIFQADFLPADNSAPLDTLLTGITCSP